MKKIVALVLSLVMALSLCTVAFAYDNGDEFYDAMTDGVAQKYTYVSKEYKADGIIIASNKFCEYWSYERVIDTVVLQRDFGYPVCSIEKEYINSASGQLRTRFQAFIESVEIKKIQGGNN